MHEPRRGADTRVCCAETRLGVAGAKGEAPRRLLPVLADSRTLGRQRRHECRRCRQECLRHGAHPDSTFYSLSPCDHGSSETRLGVARSGAESLDFPRRLFPGRAHLIFTSSLESDYPISRGDPVRRNPWRCAPMRELARNMLLPIDFSERSAGAAPYAMALAAQFGSEL